jgi:hypothetical protein
MSPDEIAVALKDFDTDWILSGREVPGLDGLSIRGWVQASGFQIRALPRWQHFYIPWALGKVSGSPTREGSELRVVFRPALGRLCYLGVALLVAVLVGAPWWSVAFVGLANHVGSLWLGFRPEVEQLESRLRDLIRGRWELR